MVLLCSCSLSFPFSTWERARTRRSTKLQKGSFLLNRQVPTTDLQPTSLKGQALLDLAQDRACSLNWRQRGQRRGRWNVIVRSVFAHAQSRARLRPFLWGSSFSHSPCRVEETSNRCHRGPETQAGNVRSSLLLWFKRQLCLTLMSLKWKVSLQYLQLSVRASHSLSLCRSLSERRMEPWQASHLIRSNSQRPSCWAYNVDSGVLARPSDLRDKYHSYFLTTQHKKQKY